MAKHQQPRSAATSRIRFIMVDAELPEGGITEITQAITAALRPVAGIAPPTRTVAQVTHVKPANGNGRGEPDAAVTHEEPLDAEVEPVEGVAAPRARRSTPRAPKVLQLDLSGPPAFEDFAKQKNPDSDQMRYLVIAYWFKHYGKIAAITIHHVYTCYRHMKWPTKIADFGSGLRTLKFRQLLEAAAGRGEYAINQLGEAAVDELGAKP